MKNTTFTVKGYMTNLFGDRSTAVTLCSTWNMLHALHVYAKATEAVEYDKIILFRDDEIFAAIGKMMD
jgi:hypothetical protein